jgi:hypothetical protein
MWKNTVVRCRPQRTIWSMRIACWIPKATDTQVVQYSLLFSCNDDYTNSLHSYVITYVKLPVLLIPARNGGQYYVPAVLSNARILRYQFNWRLDGHQNWSELNRHFLRMHHFLPFLSCCYVRLCTKSERNVSHTWVIILYLAS